MNTTEMIHYRNEMEHDDITLWQEMDAMIYYLRKFEEEKKTLTQKDMQRLSHLQMTIHVRHIENIQMREELIEEFEKAVDRLGCYV